MRKMGDDMDMALLERPDENLEFPLWLQKRWLQFFIKNNGGVSRNDFARHLGISNSNLTNYTTNLRRPDHEMADKMAAVLGPVVYDKLGLPRRMPKDKNLLLVVDVLSDPDISEQERRDLIERAKNLRDMLEERRKGRRANGGALA